MKEYKVKLIMSEEYIINAESKEEAETEAREKFGCDYYIDNVEVTEIDEKKNKRDRKTLITYIKKFIKRKYSLVPFIVAINAKQMEK